MNKYGCNCPADTHNANCSVEKKGKYRNPWKRDEDETLEATDEEQK